MRLTSGSRAAIAVLALSLLLPVVSAAQQTSGAPNGLPSVGVSAAESPEQIASPLLARVRAGLEARNAGRMMSAFDRDAMPGYLAFRDQVDSFFARYESFQVYLRIEDGARNQDFAEVVVQATLEAVPVVGRTTERRERELTFRFAQGKDGWKIVDLAPRDFFL